MRWWACAVSPGGRNARVEDFGALGLPLDEGCAVHPLWDEDTRLCGFELLLPAEGESGCWRRCWTRSRARRSLGIMCRWAARRVMSAEDMFPSLRTGRSLFIGLPARVRW